MTVPTTGTAEPVTLAPAPEGRRIGARLLDVLVFQLPLVAVALLIGAILGVAARYGADPNREDAYGDAAMVSLGITVLAWLVPSVLPEWLLRTTPGKAMLGLRVVRPDGRRPALWQALVRNLPFLPVMSMIWIGLTAWIWLMIGQFVLVAVCAAGLNALGGGFHDRLAGRTVVVQKVVAQPVAWAPPGAPGVGPAPVAKSAGWRRDPVRIIGLLIVLVLGFSAFKSCTAPGTFFGIDFSGPEAGDGSSGPTLDQPATVDREPFLDRLQRTGQRLKSSTDDDHDLREQLCDQVDTAFEEMYDVRPALSGSSIDGITQAFGDCVFEPRKTGRRLLLIVSVERG